MNKLDEIKDNDLVVAYNEIKLKITDIVVDDDTIWDATDFTKKISQLKKQVEQTKKDAVADLKEMIKVTEAPYKTLLEEIKKLDGMLRKKLLAYQSEKRRLEAERQERERQRQIEEMQKQQIEYATKGEIENAEAVGKAVEVVEAKPIVAKSTVKSLDATSSIRINWKYEITDPDAVPRELCEPAPGKINAMVKKLKEKAIDKYPGIRVYQEESIAIR